MSEIETEKVDDGFSKNKEMLDFSNYSVTQNIMMIQTN